MGEAFTLNPLTIARPRISTTATRNCSNACSVPRHSLEIDWDAGYAAGMLFDNGKELRAALYQDDEGAREAIEAWSAKCGRLVRFPTPGREFEL